MITLKTEDTSFKLKTQVHEFTVAEFNKIVNIFEQNLNYFETYWQILEVLNVPKDLIGAVSMDDMLEIIKAFSLTPKQDVDKVPPRTIEISGYTYELHPEGQTFKVNLRIAALVENAIKKHPKEFISRVLANLYTRVDLTADESVIPAHIDHKARLFSELTMDQVLALFFILMEKIVNKLKLNVENTTV